MTDSGVERCLLDADRRCIRLDFRSLTLPIGGANRVPNEHLYVNDPSCGALTNVTIGDSVLLQDVVCHGNAIAVVYRYRFRDVNDFNDYHRDLNALSSETSMISYALAASTMGTVSYQLRYPLLNVVNYEINGNATRFYSQDHR